MAIVQISQITNRKGLQVDLPQLAGAEFGWSIDTRRLFIGNGLLTEGAPVIGNTEILTEFSDIFSLETGQLYTYKGAAAGYIAQTGANSGAPIKQTLQNWLDQFATVKDFGAVGDGVTDDTDAINRALFQLYCVEPYAAPNNPQARRSLFFPAGVYRISSTIFIPPYATLYGEGPLGSVIQMDNGDDSTLTFYVARTADSLQQYGANIGNNGAIPPQDITITNMGFRNLDPTTEVFLVQDANNCRFQNVLFQGGLDQARVTLTGPAADVACVRFSSTPSLVCSQIVLDQCQFYNATWGVNTANSLGGQDQEIHGVVISNGNFNTLYRGVVMGAETPVNGGATGVRIVGNLFDNIYAEGILIGSVSLNATGHNIFYGVGNHFGPITSPFTAIIAIQTSNNISIGDMFKRPDNVSGVANPGVSYPRITLNNSASIATTNGNELSVGTYHRSSGTQITIVDGGSNNVLTISTTVAKAFAVNYTIQRDTSYRTGVLTVSTTPVAYTDDYTENAATGVTLLVSQLGTTVTVSYLASVTGNNGIIDFSLTSLF
jgi:hypothetical protein